MADKFHKYLAPQTKLLAVARVLTGEKVTQIANDLGVTRQAVHSWRKQLENNVAEGFSLPKSPNKPHNVVEGFSLPKSPNLAENPGGTMSTPLDSKHPTGFTVVMKGKPLTKNNIHLSYKMLYVPSNRIKKRSLAKEKRAWEQAIAWERELAYTARQALSKNGMGPFSGPVGAEIWFYFSRKKDNHPGRIRKDLDNFTKSVLDGLEKGGVFKHGDHQVIDLTTHKRVDNENPRVEVKIIPKSA